jgi:hypothetical protein
LKLKIFKVLQLLNPENEQINLGTDFYLDIYLKRTLSWHLSKYNKPRYPAPTPKRPTK